MQTATKCPRWRVRLAAAAILLFAGCSDDGEENTPLGPPGPDLPAMTSTAATAYDIVRVDAITVDGDLSEWSGISEISMEDDPTNGRGDENNTAKVKLAWNDTHLYAAYNVTDTELLALQTVRDHDDIYKDDEVELYIDPQGDGATHSSMTSTDYQFLANLRDALGDQNGDGAGGKDETYNANSFLGKAVANGSLNATGADAGYTVELQISWSDLGVTPAAGHAMRMDLAVGDRDGSGPPPVQSFDWAGLDKVYNQPSAWKEVRLVDPPVEPAYEIVKQPGITIDGNLGEWDGIAEIAMTDDDDRGAETNSARVKLAWDDTYLYAAYDVTDTELLAVQTERDHGDIYKDDEVELYLDPQGDGATDSSMTTTDYQFLANIRDAVRDMNGDGAGGKDGGYTANTLLAKAVTNGSLNATGTDAGYQVELRVGWSDLDVVPAEGKLMRADLAIGDRDGDGPPPVESFDWAELGNVYNNPSAWKDVRLSGESGPPPDPGAAALRVGLYATMDVDLIGTGPGNDAGEPIYKVVLGRPSHNPNNSNYVDSLIKKADQHDVLLLLTLAGNRGAWTNPQTVDGKECLFYDQDQFEQNVDLFDGNEALADALQRRRAVVFVVDEPYHPTFCNSIPPSKVDSMGRYIKGKYPGAITLVRGPSNFMTGGWAGESVHDGFWTGIDYGWSQYAGNLAASTGKTPSEFYSDEKRAFAEYNLGMIPGHNIWNVGNDTCWDHDLDSGTSHGRIYGSESDTEGDEESCDPNTTNKRWVSSPAVLKASIDAAYNDPDAPFFLGWTHITEASNHDLLEPLEVRQDFVEALEYWITKGQARTTWNGWRPAK